MPSVVPLVKITSFGFGALRNFATVVRAALRRFAARLARRALARGWRCRSSRNSRARRSPPAAAEWSRRYRDTPAGALRPAGQVRESSPATTGPCALCRFEGKRRKHRRPRHTSTGTPGGSDNRVHLSSDLSVTIVTLLSQICCMAEPTRLYCAQQSHMSKAAAAPHSGRQRRPAINTGGRRWLLFVHQLPPTPSNLRVRTWRRLQELGAVAVKQSVYALPDSPESREDFEWLKVEIEGSGGEASVLLGRACRCRGRGCPDRGVP
jgi:hypothetical protein